MKRSQFFVLVIALALTHCNPYPIYNYKISSLDEEKLFYKGREIISKESNDLLVLINYEDQVKYELIFNLAIINQSDHTIEVDPTKICLEIHKTYPPDKYGNKIVTLFSIDPETRIQSLKESLLTTKSNKQISDATNVFVSLAEIFKDISELGQEKTTTELHREFLIDQEKRQVMASQELHYQSTINNIYENRYYWENIVLRKTTLNPGDEISGYIHFPLDENARVVKIVVPFNDTLQSFSFESRPLIN